MKISLRKIHSKCGTIVIRKNYSLEANNDHFVFESVTWTALAMPLRSAHKINIADTDFIVGVDFNLMLSLIDEDILGNEVAIDEEMDQIIGPVSTYDLKKLNPFSTKFVTYYIYTLVGPH